jgi:hypothetical protein
VIVTTELAHTKCWCGTPFMVPTDLLKAAHNGGHEIYCPHGHKMQWKETETDRMRRDRDRLAQRLAERDDEIARQRRLREETERRLAATKGVVTRIRNRVGHGVCPCCTRSFGNLQRHMKTQHPDWVAEAAE